MVAFILIAAIIFYFTGLGGLILAALGLVAVATFWLWLES